MNGSAQRWWVFGFIDMNDTWNQKARVCAKSIVDASRDDRKSQLSSKQEGFVICISFLSQVGHYFRVRVIQLGVPIVLAKAYPIEMRK